MTTATEPQPADAFPPLTRDVIHKVVLYCGGLLPPPLGATADDRACRDNAALAEVAALEPANDAEVTQAMRYVAAGAWADDQLRLAILYADDFVRSQQIMKQYAMMMRSADGARSTLLRVQTARKRREKDSAGSERDAALRRGVLVSLTEARTELEGPIEAGAAAVAAAKAAAAAAKAAAETAVADAKAAAAAAKAAAETAVADAATAEAAQRAADAEPPPPLTPEQQEREKWLIEADSFSTIYPMRARLIRRFGKLPDDCGIEQPGPELTEALRTGDGYGQLWADALTPAEAYVNAGKDRFLCKYEEVEAAVPEPIVAVLVVPEAAVPEVVVPEPVVPEPVVAVLVVPEAAVPEQVVPEQVLPEPVVVVLVVPEAAVAEPVAPG